MVAVEADWVVVSAGFMTPQAPLESRGAPSAVPAAPGCRLLVRSLACTHPAVAASSLLFSSPPYWSPRRQQLPRLRRPHRVARLPRSSQPAIRWHGFGTGSRVISPAMEPVAAEQGCTPTKVQRSIPTARARRESGPAYGGGQPESRPVAVSRRRSAAPTMPIHHAAASKRSCGLFRAR